MAAPATDALPGAIVLQSPSVSPVAVTPTLAEVDFFDVAYVGVATVVEALLLLAAARGGVSFSAALLLHVLTVALLGAAMVVRRRNGRDLTAPLMTLMVVIASGPIGGAVMLPVLLALRRPTVPSALLSDWYQRLSLAHAIEPETRLSERVAASRVIDTGAPPPASFEDVMRRGALDERQRALGLVARNFHPAYLPMLATSLASEEPVIRVQAAAVAARVRQRLATDVARWIGEARQSAEYDTGALVLIRDLASAATSGLLDRPLEEAARKAASALTERVDVARLVLRQKPGMADEMLLDMLEGRLLAARDFSGLRLLRRRRRLAAKGYRRLRRIARRPSRRSRLRRAVRRPSYTPQARTAA